LKRFVTTREGSSKLGVLPSLPPLSIVGMLHVTSEVSIFSVSISSMWLTFLELFCLLRLWSLHFVSFSFPFLGALKKKKIDKVSSLVTKI